MSPWSIPSSVSWAFVSPYAVITWFVWFVRVSMIMLVMVVGIFILFSNFFIMRELMESKALLMSWLKIQASLPFSLASSAILFRICIGC